MRKELTPTQFKAYIDSGASPVLLDVREPHELEICKLDFAVHIPLGDVPNRYKELLPFDREIIVMCRSGARSTSAAQYLESQGFTNLTNLTGGILRWGKEVDPTIQQY